MALRQGVWDSYREPSYFGVRSVTIDQMTLTLHLIGFAKSI